MNNSLNMQTYENLKKDIMTLALMPGEPVSAAKIAERYNVSRTPAREALVKLEGEALVDIYPQSASVISKIDIDRAEQEWFVRRTLEMGVVDGLFEHATDNDIETMRELNEEMKVVSKKMTDPGMIYEYLRCDNEFHTVAFLAAGQELAAELELSLESVIELRRLKKTGTLSYDNKIKDFEDNDSYGETIADTSQKAVWELVNDEQNKQLIAELLQRLSPRARTVIELRYGFRNRH